MEYSSNSVICNVIVTHLLFCKNTQVIIKKQMNELALNRGKIKSNFYNNCKFVARSLAMFRCQ